MSYPIALSDEAREAQREYKRNYMREWRARNKDKVQENNRKYWERKAAKAKEVEQNAESHQAE